MNRRRTVIYHPCRCLDAPRRAATCRDVPRRAATCRDVPRRAATCRRCRGSEGYALCNALWNALCNADAPQAPRGAARRRHAPPRAATRRHAPRRAVTRRGMPWCSTKRSVGVRPVNRIHGLSSGAIVIGCVPSAGNLARRAPCGDEGAPRGSQRAQARPMCVR